MGWRNYAAELRPVAFTSPSSSSAVVLADVQKLTGPASGDAHFDLSFVPPDGVWLGLQLRVYPVGPKWSDLVGAWTAFGSRTWNSLDTFVVRNLLMSAPAAGAARSGSVFAGRVTDLSAQFDPGLGGTVVDVVCQDDTAELGNRYVGAAPYPLETLGTRFARIVADSEQTISYTVDAGVASRQVTYQDVDSRPAIDLLQELAKSAGGVLWAATTVAIRAVPPARRRREPAGDAEALRPDCHEPLHDAELRGQLNCGMARAPATRRSRSRRRLPASKAMPGISAPGDAHHRDDGCGNVDRDRLSVIDPDHSREDVPLHGYARLTGVRRWRVAPD